MFYMLLHGFGKQYDAVQGQQENILTEAGENYVQRAMEVVRKD